MQIMHKWLYTLNILRLQFCRQGQKIVMSEVETNINNSYLQEQLTYNNSKCGGDVTVVWTNCLTDAQILIRKYQSRISVKTGLLNK